MLFNSLEYAIFLVVVFLVYWGLARAGLMRIVFLTVASYVFYAASNPWFLTLIFASTLTDYFAGMKMGQAAESGRPRAKKAWLVLSLAMNLGLLGVFKYANFFYESLVDVANVFGAGMTFSRLDILLPAGISFYTFQTMSYSIDVYRGLLKPERSLMRFSFFVGYFPQLIAGPIVRAVDFLPQIGRRPFLSRDQVSRALWLIGIGLFKKVVIADYIGINLVDRIFDAPERFSSAEVYLGLFGYTMQIYMDFSAYSDIAIGSALLFGFHLPDNFNRPYLATSVADFWKRWHMSLGTWLRDYLYYPLGGSKGGAWFTYRNLFITFILIGLWHGASWTFVVYGALHALAMCINRFMRVNVRGREKPKMDWWGWTWRIFLTLHFVVMTRILFRSQSFGQAGDIVDALFQGTWHVTAMTPTLWVMLVGSFIVHWTPRAWVDRLGAAFERVPAFAQGALVTASILLIMQVAHSDVKPFIYFQF